MIWLVIQLAREDEGLETGYIQFWLYLLLVLCLFIFTALLVTAKPKLLTKARR